MFHDHSSELRVPTRDGPVNISGLNLKLVRQIGIWVVKVEMFSEPFVIIPSKQIPLPHALRRQHFRGDWETFSVD